MKLAITGPTGFIGRHVVKEALSRSIVPTLVCRPQSTVPALFAGCPLVRLDIHALPDDAFDALGRPDTLLHLAWEGLPNYRSTHHVERELPAQFAFLNRLIEDGLRSVVVTGTCFEYGQVSGSIAEGVEPHPTNAYGQAKDRLRRQLESLRARTPFNLTWARLFYVYGDGQAESSLLPQLRKAAEQGQRAFPMSGGEQLRDYLRVEDVARYLVSLALTARDNGVVNICSGRPISIRELVERWIAENAWSITPDLGKYPYPDYEPMAFWGDACKLHGLVAS